MLMIIAQAQVGSQLRFDFSWWPVIALIVIATIGDLLYSVFCQMAQEGKVPIYQRGRMISITSFVTWFLFLLLRVPSSYWWLYLLAIITLVIGIMMMVAGHGSKS